MKPCAGLNSAQAGSAEDSLQGPDVPEGRSSPAAQKTKDEHYDTSPIEPHSWPSKPW
eukprot:CAMPEP_0197658210 /NCGR_PEP_ID=MMETSP1338-20131121/45104_1 /TAXON_ID=43686 ORGANISM="Pelagodinium beii, Strain RCC1491" /NCGR_SAMPLE_ID=MMETSP1338 /ASSEMBLY_ACC=CAM_ASM_000754 /LENGTH=56 /DNA_ID=CAMNT_0043234757 /DNA_START=352 /DNA_END=520 /DNA_ORIENTATION=+